MTSQQSRSEKWLRVFIPLCGVLIAGLLAVVALGIAPDDQAQGFQRNAEIMNTCLTLAVAFISGAVVSFLIGEYGRAADDSRKKAEELGQQRRKEADELNQQQKDDASEKRRLVGELREVHHAIKTAQLRMNAHKSVLTYGTEIRDVIIPKISQLGGVFSDVRRHSGDLIPASKAKAITDQIGIVRSYLEALTKEYEQKYLAASLLQEADYKWRQDKVGTIVKGLQEPPTEADLPETGKTDSYVWRYLKSREDSGQYRFPWLLVFLELLDENDLDSLDEHKERPYTHTARFSDPVRYAMDKIDQSQRRSE
jgi:hypothetical protein